MWILTGNANASSVRIYACVKSCMWIVCCVQVQNILPVITIYTKSFSGLALQNVQVVAETKSRPQTENLEAPER